MSTAPLLPDRIETLDEVSKRDQGLYGRDAMGDAYELTYIGTALAKYRQAAAENPGGQVPPPRKLIRFDREGWSQLIAIPGPISCAAQLAERSKCRADAMAHKPKSIFDIALADAQWRQAHLAREFHRKNAAAARSVEANARVIGAGAVRNALGGIAPVVAERRRQRRRRR